MPLNKIQQQMLEQTVQDRLNKVDEHTEQLADEASLRKISNDFVQYGKIKFPSDFTKTLPFELYRDLDGRIKHTFDPNSLKSSTQNVYLSRESGLDTNNGLSTTAPVKTLTKALEIANGLAGSVANIFFMDKFNPYLLSNPSVNNQTFTLSKNINLLSNQQGGTYIFSGNDPSGFTWTPDNVTYKTPRSAAQAVIDYKFKDFKGNPMVLEKRATLTEVVNNKGTWYTDGTSVWINRLDGSIPNNDVAILLPIDTNVIFNLNGYRMLVENVHFWMKQNTQAYDALKVDGNSSSSLYVNKSSFRFSSLNGLAPIRVGAVYVFNSVASDNGYDGFNYHGNGGATPYEFVFEFEIYSYKNGAIVNGTGNATTAHDGMNVLRVGSVGHDCYGPILADVNGCYSLNYDCIMYDSLRGAGSTKSAYYFDETGALKSGKAYLINCGGGGAGTYTINTDGNVDVYVQNLKGNNIPSNLVLNQFV